MAHPINGLSQLLSYLASIPADSDQRIPPLSQLSKELNLSIATLREQLEVARMIGVVEVKPKTGIRKKPYSFYQSIKPGLEYAAAENTLSFQQFSDLRKHLEAAYFIEAAQSLSDSDVALLEGLIKTAMQKIDGFPVQVPSEEHRQFHTSFYKNLNNHFLNGILEAYWDIYHLHGYEVYPDHDYLVRVWQYHARVMEQVKAGNFSQGLSILVEHMELVNQREKVIPRLSFE